MTVQADLFGMGSTIVLAIFSRQDQARPDRTRPHHHHNEQFVSECFSCSKSKYMAIPCFFDQLSSDRVIWVPITWSWLNKEY